RRELSRTERDALLAQSFDSLQNLVAALPDLNLPVQDQNQLAQALDAILRFDPEHLAADGYLFDTLYKPISVLPPDQYLALVLQATEGCSWNRCTFCGLYRDRDFRIHSPESFRAHCQAVRDFYAEGISLRRGIFLADANALIIPQPRLTALIEIAQAYFGQPNQPTSIYSFISAFDVNRKSAAEWAELHSMGLERAYIGLETGDDALLRFLNKPGSVQDAIEAVHALRAGGVAVGVILMAGIGGDQFAETHMQRSVEAIQQMDLGPDDLVYLSHYVSVPGTEYDYQATVAGIRALTNEEIAAQMRALQAAVRQIVPPQTRVSPYRVDGFAL
ncbi:MAG TPA: radical SAM protein, partial [Aggregatilineaceae bacterium]|nr:radical SAM protein [Aggregatilineaceae bacterium]